MHRSRSRSEPNGLRTRTLFSPRRRGVEEIRQRLVAVGKQILPRSLGVLTSAHEHTLGARGELERVTAPDDDIGGASRLKALYLIILPISLPGILTVVIFAFSLCVNEFIYAFTFISSSEQRTVSAGIPNDLIRGDVFFWQSLMAATLIPAIPLALLYNAFLDRFIKGFTGGAFR